MRMVYRNLYDMGMVMRVPRYGFILPRVGLQISVVLSLSPSCRD